MACSEDYGKYFCALGLGVSGASRRRCTPRTLTTCLMPRRASTPSAKSTGTKRRKTDDR